MAKLTTIEDVERRNAEAEEEREMLEAQEALQHAQPQEDRGEGEAPQVVAGMKTAPKPAEQPAQASGQPAGQEPGQAEPDVEFDPEFEMPAKAKEVTEDRTAKEEEDFHGLSSEDSMSGMQKVLIILAAIILIAAILYVVNSWVHFV